MKCPPRFAKDLKTRLQSLARRRRCRQRLLVEGEGEQLPELQQGPHKLDVVAPRRPPVPLSENVGQRFDAMVPILRNLRVSRRSTWRPARSSICLKPVLLAILVAVAIYTYTKKDFGQHEAKDHPPKKELLFAIAISLIIGFYDGFIGPGAGSFLILAFISLLGYDFLHASAQAKLVNLATNLGSIVLFTIKGKILWTVAFPMAACNAVGGMLGAKMAIAKGNKFIRIFFLVVILGTLTRFAWDVLF